METLSAETPQTAYCPARLADTFTPLPFEAKCEWHRVFHVTELDTLLNPPVGDINDPLERGRDAETDFYHLLLQNPDRFQDPTYAPVMMDWKDHVDVIVTDLKTTWRHFDVKSAKRLVGKMLDAHIWIELYGKYREGWLRAKKVDALAFQQSDGSFIVADRLALCELVESRADQWPQANAVRSAEGGVQVSDDGATGGKGNTRLRLMPVEEVLALPKTERWAAVTTRASVGDYVAPLSDPQ